MSDTYTAALPMVITWGDCDAAGISYYARYFDWFTNGRMFFLKKNGLPYMTAFHDQGITIVGLKAECQYKHTLRPEDEVVLETTLAELTKTRVAFTYKILKEDGTIAAFGRTEHAFVDQEGKPFNLSKRYPEKWQELNKMIR